MTIYRNGILISLTFLSLLLAVQEPLRAEESLWQSGMNLYIKYEAQEEITEGATPANQHPITLNAKEITNALTLIRVWDKHLLKQDELKTLFSPEQARLLGQFLADGLTRAQPNQDIIFSIPRRERKFVVIQNMVYTAGRVFYANDRLNLILGDFERPPDLFKERSHQSSGISEIRYYFNHGRRAKKSKFDHGLVNKAGVSNYQEGTKLRKDWFLIDVSAASAAYIAEQPKEEEGSTTASEALIREEAAKLAKERREMRLEMARLRKEMEQSATGEGKPAVSGVEERLRALDELKEKQLVTEEEYQAKRKEILGDL